MRFYLKKGGWGWSIYHRATHNYLHGSKTMEEAAQYIEEMNLLNDTELWKSLLFDYKVRLPRKEVYSGMGKDAGYDEQERGYKHAWRYGTEEFYEAYPELLVEEKLDYDFINRVQHQERQRRALLEEEKRRSMFRRSVRRIVENGIVKLQIRKLA